MNLYLLSSLLKKIKIRNYKIKLYYLMILLNKKIEFFNNFKIAQILPMATTTTTINNINHINIRTHHKFANT